MLPGCFLGACCVPIQIVNSGPTSSVRIRYSAGGVSAYVQEIQVYGYKTVADTPPIAFQQLLATRYGQPTFAQTQPDYLFVAKALATGPGEFTPDKSYFLYTPSPAVPFYTALLNDVCTYSAGEMAWRNDIIDELDFTFTDPYAFPATPPPNTVAKSTELGQAARDAGVAAGAWVAAYNTETNTAQSIYDIEDQRCVDYGCQISNMPNEFGYPAVFGVRSLTEYTTEFVTVPTLSWGDLFLGESTCSGALMDFGTPGNLNQAYLIDYNYTQYYQ